MKDTNEKDFIYFLLTILKLHFNLHFQQKNKQPVFKASNSNEMANYYLPWYKEPLRLLD